MITKRKKEIILSIRQMKTIISGMKENQRREPAMSDRVKFQLSFDTDWDAFVIDPETKGYQFSRYAECNGMEVGMETKNH
jgi:hypothetical protein